MLFCCSIARSSQAMESVDACEKEYNSSASTLSSALGGWMRGSTSLTSGSEEGGELASITSGGEEGGVWPGDGPAALGAGEAVPAPELVPAPVPTPAAGAAPGPPAPPTLILGLSRLPPPLRTGPRPLGGEGGPMRGGGGGWATRGPSTGLGTCCVKWGTTVFLSEYFSKITF